MKGLKMHEKIVIGGAELWYGDCREILPGLLSVDAIITDPPYSEKTHNGHNSVAKNAKINNIYRGKVSSKITRFQLSAIPYDHLTQDECSELAALFANKCRGWIVWMSDHTLAPIIADSLYAQGRYVFAPLPHYAPGRSVRLTGDGPSSWTDWIIVSRTKAQSKWGTLPGGYVTTSGNADNIMPGGERMIGGKPLRLMESLVTDYSRPGQTVLDPFMGAGTTGSACAIHGRRFIGIEIDRARFDASCLRIENAQKQHGLFAPELHRPQPMQFDAYT